MEASSSPPSWALGDETVRLAISPSTPTPPPPVNILSWGRWGWLGVGHHSHHPPPWIGSVLRLEGDRGMSRGTHWWSVVGHWCNSHLSLFSLLRTMIRGTIITGHGLLQLVPSPSEAGFLLGDGYAEAFEVFSPQVYLLLNPPLRFEKFPFAILNEVVQLSLELSTVPPEIV